MRAFFLPLLLLLPLGLLIRGAPDLKYYRLEQGVFGIGWMALWGKGLAGRVGEGMLPIVVVVAIYMQGPAIKEIRRPHFDPNGNGYS